MMIRLSRLALFGAVAFAVLGVFATFSFAPHSDLPFVVGTEDRDLGGIPVGRSTFLVTVTNPSDHPRRIIGVKES